MGIAFLFPGQGSQHAGMLHCLPDHPSVASTLAEINDALDKDVQDLDCEQSLGTTTGAQLSIFTAGVAVGRSLLALGIRPKAVAGLSVGAYAAAVISGSLSTAHGVKLVRQRAEMMEQMFQTGYGMSAIVGLDQHQVMNIIATVADNTDPVYIANVNAARQIVISGSRTAMEFVMDEAIARGARKAERLNVAVPSHCKLLAPVSTALRSTLAAMTLKQPDAIYISNATARPLRNAADIGSDLADNIANTVHWYEGNVLLKELGCTLFLEMNPGRILSDLANENVPDVRSEALEFSSLKHTQKLALKAIQEGC
jgi:malonate decarboxylase epsilon subunit